MRFADLRLLVRPDCFGRSGGGVEGLDTRCRE